MDNLFAFLVVVGIAGIIYFRKKDKKKRNISIIVSIIAFLLFGITSPEEDKSEGDAEDKTEDVIASEDAPEDDDEVQKKQVDEKETPEVSDDNEESKEAEKDTTEVSDDEENEENKEDDKNQDDEQIDDINAELAEFMEQNKGFALGTLDENGEPTEDGEPNPDFAWSLYVHELIYNGNDLEMKTDAGFLDLSDAERTEVANRAQNIGNSVIGMYEDWDINKYQNRLFLTVSNGKNVLGNSKIIDVTEFKWYD